MRQHVVMYGISKVSISGSDHMVILLARGCSHHDRTHRRASLTGSLHIRGAVTAHTADIVPPHAVYHRHKCVCASLSRRGRDGMQHITAHVPVVSQHTVSHAHTPPPLSLRSLRRHCLSQPALAHLSLSLSLACLSLSRKAQQHTQQAFARVSMCVLIIPPACS